MLSSPKWQCFPCAEGLRITLPAQSPQYLPLHIAEDMETDSIPLSVELDEEEVCELRCQVSKEKNASVIAATHYGPPPPTQEKSENQDFSLSAIIRDQKSQEWAFVSVADGVSTKTFWPARTSRIACLVAYKVIRRFILDNCDGLGQQNQPLLEDLRDQLGVELQNHLRLDQAALKKSDLTPASWSTETYKKFIERDQLWYNSTLLLALLGPLYGFVFYAGDGGIELVNHHNSGVLNWQTILKTPDSLAIDSFVSLAVTGRNFAGRPIFYGDQVNRVDVFLSSDGVDRTLQLNGNIPHHQLQMHTSQEAYQRLKELAQREKCEADNYSIARASRMWGENKHDARVYESRLKNPENGAKDETPTYPPSRSPAPNAPSTNSLRHDHQTRKPFGAKAIVTGLAGLVIGVFIGAAGAAWIKNRLPARDDVKSPRPIQTQVHSTLRAVSHPISLSSKDEELLARKNAGPLTNFSQNQLSEWLRVISQAPDQNYVVIAHLSCSGQRKQRNKRARRIAGVIQDLLADKAEEAEQPPTIRAGYHPCDRPPQDPQLVKKVYLAIDAMEARL